MRIGRSTWHRRLAIIGLGASLAIGIASVASAGGAIHASATMRDATGAALGWAKFTEDASGTLHVTVHVKGMSPGLHGIHIHAVGDCDPFGAAGSHLNAGGQFHGLANTLGSPHAGDLPNLRVNGAGVGQLAAVSDRAGLSASSILDGDGSALVIHLLPDDQSSQPIGGSGDRIACGEIEAD